MSIVVGAVSVLPSFTNSGPAPLLLNSTHEDVMDSDKRIRNAIRGSSEHPCLWLRRILPNALGEHSGKALDHPPLFSFGDLALANVPWQYGSYGTDASGGMFSSVPAL